MATTITLAVSTNKPEVLFNKIAQLDQEKLDLQEPHPLYILDLVSSSVSAEMLRALAMNESLLKRIKHIKLEKPLSLAQDNLQDYIEAFVLLTIRTKPEVVFFKTKEPRTDLEDELINHIERVQHNITFRNMHQQSVSNAKLLLTIFSLMSVYLMATSVANDGAVSFSFVGKAIFSLLLEGLTFTYLEDVSDKRDEFEKYVRFEEKEYDLEKEYNPIVKENKLREKADATKKPQLTLTNLTSSNRHSSFSLLNQYRQKLVFDSKTNQQDLDFEESTTSKTSNP